MAEGASGFEQIVTDSLGRLENKVDVLTNEVGMMKASSQVEKMRRDRIGRPLADWTLEDSVALKSMIEREKRRKPTVEEEAQEEAKDRRLSRVQSRLATAGVIFAILQSLFNPLGTAWHYLKGAVHS